MRLATSVRIQDPLGFLLQSLMPPLAEAGLGVEEMLEKGTRKVEEEKRQCKRKH